VGLVLDVQPQCQALLLVTPSGDLGHGSAEPGRERVGVHRDREVRLQPVPVRERLGRLLLEQPGLPGQPQEHLARRGRPAGGGALHDHLADDGLQRPDPLADRRRRHVQGAGRRVERAVVRDRDQCLQVRRVEPGNVQHEVMLMVLH
jgi:hypothetical protein